MHLLSQVVDKEMNDEQNGRGLSIICNLRSHVNSNVKQNPAVYERAIEESHYHFESIINNQLSSRDVLIGKNVGIENMVIMIKLLSNASLNYSEDRYKQIVEQLELIMQKACIYSPIVAREAVRAFGRIAVKKRLVVRIFDTKCQI